MTFRVQPDSPAEYATSAVGHVPGFVDQVTVTAFGDEGCGPQADRKDIILSMMFHEYVDAVDAAMRELWMIDTFDAQVGPDELSEAQDRGMTPTEFALHWGKANGLLTR